jgi:hypothetical protein
VGILGCNRRSGLTDIPYLPGCPGILICSSVSEFSVTVIERRPG